MCPTQVVRSYVALVPLGSSTLPQNLAKHRTATLVDLRRVAQRIHYVNRKGGDSVQERTK